MPIVSRTESRDLATVYLVQNNIPPTSETKQNDRATAGKSEEVKTAKCFSLSVGICCLFTLKIRELPGVKVKSLTFSDKRLFNLVCICAGTVNHYKTFLARWR